MVKFPNSQSEKVKWPIVNHFYGYSKNFNSLYLLKIVNYISMCNLSIKMYFLFFFRILGLHVNMYFFGLTSWDLVKYIIVNWFPFLVSKEEYNIAFPIKKQILTFLKEGGYFHIQATKPDTLGKIYLFFPHFNETNKTVSIWKF